MPAARVLILVSALCGSLAFTSVSAAQSKRRGDREVRILGGAKAAPGQFPWMAQMVDAAARSTEDGFWCGGTVIAPRVVLTAAHCVEDVSAREIDMVVGRLRLSQDQDGERIDVSKIVSHPEYSPQTFRHDVALIQLATPAAVQPAEIVWGQTAADLGRAGARVLTAGWGLTSESGVLSDALRFVRLRVRSNVYCDKQYGEVHEAKALCIRGVNAGEDSCQGDSGGPAFAGEDASAKILGIVSYGTGCGRARVPGVYTRVAYYEKWIKDNTAFLNGDSTTPPEPPARPNVKIGEITCGAVKCTVPLHVTGRDPEGGIVVNIVRAARKGRKAVDRYVVAGKVSDGLWRIRHNLPIGRLTIYAFPINGEYDDLDGDGDVVDVRITRG